MLSKSAKEFLVKRDSISKRGELEVYWFIKFVNERVKVIKIFYDT